MEFVQCPCLSVVGSGELAWQRELGGVDRGDLLVVSGLDHGNLF